MRALGLAILLALMMSCWRAPVFRAMVLMLSPDWTV
jgi:hypothetical protein